MAESSKRYDLEDRTLKFAKDVRAFVKLLPRTIGNIEDLNLFRASDFVLRTSDETVGYKL